MAIEAGKLRNLITLQRDTAGKKVSGAHVPTWQTYATVHAEDLPATSTEVYKAKQVNSLVSGVLRIRWRAGISPTHQVLLGTRTLNLLGVRDPEGGRKRELLLDYQEISTGT